MFPLKDNIPAKLFPVVNITVIVVNFLFFGLELLQGDGFRPFIVKYGFVPSRFLAAQNANWLDVSRFVPVFSSMFLHGNFLHVFSNMWMLWIFGDNVEDSMGHGRYIFFYLLCGVSSVFMQTVMGGGSHVPMIGASGAISGVLGAYFFLYPRARIVTFIPLFVLFYLIEVPAFFFLGFWFLLQFFEGSAQWLAGPAAKGGIAWWAHVGGFGVGLSLIYFFKRGGPNRVKKQ